MPRRITPALRILLRPAVLLVLLVSGAGCATYQQARLEDLPPQQRVRLRLAPEELARNISFVSGHQGLISGRFIEVRGDSATFLLTTPTSHQQVRLSLQSILQLERKDPSHSRSILLSAAVVGGVATLAYLGFEGRQGADTPGDEPTEAFLPAIRFVIPVGW